LSLLQPRQPLVAVLDRGVGGASAEEDGFAPIRRGDERVDAKVYSNDDLLWMKPI
jgi:hypothetical protein